MPPKSDVRLTAQHEPKTNIETRHKVIRFGHLYGGFSENYKFLHQRIDLKVTRGDIPIDFLSSMVLEEGTVMYLETREGRTLDPPGPEYQVSWRKDREVIGPTKEFPDGWHKSLDRLWECVLSHLERKNLVSEETLLYLDADPFVLFGIDDPITQQALQKLKETPALVCENTVPSKEEWAHYLRIDVDDDDLMWLVQAFAETELPKPWTCYKGVGSIVCYINASTGVVQWKHPFYDYFKQLRDFCRTASLEEILQVRVNRLLWSYEATRVETDHDQDPLISPEFVSRMADIFGYNIKTQGFLVRNIKAQLKVFARSYRKTQTIDLKDVAHCADMLARDVEKFEEMRDYWSNKITESVDFELTALSDGQIVCVNCGKTALSFCLECKDYLCISCYELLHSKGARLSHSPFRLVPCSICVDQPAKLHCTFTDRSLCHPCYAMKHIKMLPADGKENQPRRIDYMQQYARYAEFAAERVHQYADLALKGNTEADDYESVLSTDWHPFYDVRGVKFYHNFSTGERMRQSPRRLPNTEDPGVQEALTAAANKALDKRLPTNALDLTGYDDLSSKQTAAQEAAEDPYKRALRAPHRKHMPMEVMPD